MPRMDHGSGMAGSGSSMDHGFVIGMLPHHQAAIDMAKVELQKGKNLQVKALAQTIIDEQTSEQVLMRRVAASHSWSTSSSSMGADQLMGQPIRLDLGKMAGDVSAADNADSAFLQLMIPHHAMAAVMADTVARYGTDAQLKQLAASIVAGQAREIGQMQALLGTLSRRAGGAVGLAVWSPPLDPFLPLAGPGSGGRPHQGSARVEARRRALGLGFLLA